MEILPLLMQLVSGAGGGGAVGKLRPKFDQGILINLGIGLFGGLVCARFLGMVIGSILPEAGSMDPLFIIANIVGGIVGGGALLVAVGSFGGGPIGQK